MHRHGQKIKITLDVVIPTDVENVDSVSISRVSCSIDCQERLPLVGACLGQGPFLWDPYCLLGVRMRHGVFMRA